MSLLSTHFTLEELTHSDTGFPNQPAEPEMDNLRRTAHYMESVRDLLGHPIAVYSGYRTPAVNVAVGGATDSAHCRGFAVDFTCAPFGTPRQCALRIASSGLPFDQLIYEGTWVHISFAPTWRRQVLTGHHAAGKPKTYTTGIEGAAV